MKKPVTVYAACAAVLLSIAVAHAGGWSVVTLSNLPQYAVAETPLALTFMVRAHGLTPVAELEPTVAATSQTDLGTLTLSVVAVPARRIGEYAATLVLPKAGDWTVQINGNTTLELLAIEPGSPAPAPFSQRALGERLFVAKGCIACHVNGEVQLQGRNFGNIGPELTGKRFADTYLKDLLADPAATRGPDTRMPDLDLASSEIDSLTAFINRQ